MKRLTIAALVLIAPFVQAAEKFECVAWYIDENNQTTRKILEQQPYDEEYYETSINGITYGMLFMNSAKHEPGFIIFDEKRNVAVTTEGSLRRIPDTLVNTASAHYYRYEEGSKQVVAQVSCFLEYL